MCIPFLINFLRIVTHCIHSTKILTTVTKISTEYLWLFEEKPSIRCWYLQTFPGISNTCEFGESSHLLINPQSTSPFGLPIKPDFIYLAQSGRVGAIVWLKLDSSFKIGWSGVKQGGTYQFESNWEKNHI